MSMKARWYTSKARAAWQDERTLYVRRRVAHPLASSHKLPRVSAGRNRLLPALSVDAAQGEAIPLPGIA